MTKPYYQDEWVTIYHGDCREILPELPKLPKVDLILTDPPYGIRWQSGRRQQAFNVLEGDNSCEAAIEGLRLALPLLTRGRHVYVFGRYELSSLPLKSITELIWDKENKNSGDLSIPWGNQHEYIQFAVYDISKAGRATHTAPARLRKGTVLRYLRLNADAVQRHPTEKPVSLLRELIESSSRHGETVLDIFAGVGSTMVAAKAESRHCIGIEIEEKYCEIAAKRCSQSVFKLEV